MNEKQTNLIKSILGDDFLEVLAKSESSAIIKENTQTGTSPEDIKVALQIVPRAILGWLFSNLKWRDVGDNIELEIPFANGTLMANKLSPDNYSGEVVCEGERVVRFKFRSLPAIGLILMSTFELYDMQQLDEIRGAKTPEQESKEDKLQDMIDERLNMHSLITNVVDKRITEREAIAELIRTRLSNTIAMVNLKHTLATAKEEEPVQSKKSKLKEFLDNREYRSQEPVELDKSEGVQCPDCNSVLYKSEKDIVKLCICYGSHMHKEIKFKKTEDGKVKFNFPKSFDIDNIEMLLDALKGSGV